jgi:copper chaperone CopZ
MDEFSVTVPAMWADHHVLTVRDALGSLTGVSAVSASAKDRTLNVSYDPKETDPAALSACLAANGYEPGEIAPDDAPPTNKPAWATAGGRTTTTSAVDLTMSGDHRKY